MHYQIIIELTIYMLESNMNTYVVDYNISLLPSWDGGNVALCQSEADVDSDDLQGDQEVKGQVQTVTI